MSFNFLVEEFSFQARTLFFQLSSRRSNRKKILVNGTPKTGTTWMVRLLDSLPGYTWQQDFGKQGIAAEGQLLQGMPPGTILHAHYPYSLDFEDRLLDAQFSVVIMLRDPRDQIISNLFHLRRDSTNAWHQDFLRFSDAAAIMALIEGLPGHPEKPALRSICEVYDISLSWQSARRPVLFIRYEDLIQDSAQEFQHVLAFAGISIAPPLVEAVAERNRFERLSVGRKFWKPARQTGQVDPNSHFRKGITGDWRNYLTTQHIERFKEVSGELLIRLGYETSQTW